MTPDERMNRIEQMVHGREKQQRLRQLMEGSGYMRRVATIIQFSDDMPTRDADETPDIDSETLQNMQDKDSH